MGDIFEDIDWTEGMEVPVKRRVAALREVQEEFDKLQKAFNKEQAELEVKYQKLTSPLQDQRSSIVAGTTEVGAYDIPAAAGAKEEDQGIPDFWLNAMTNHDMVGEFITEADSGVLAYLTDVRSTSLTGDHAGSFKLSFYFRENPYFKNEVLEKTFYLEDPIEIVPEKFVGTTIDWSSGKNTTVKTVRKKMKDKKLKGKAPAVTVTDTVPCDSFFNFFGTPNVPADPNDMEEEDLERLQEQMDEEYEIACAFKDSIIPRAVEWFTGEAAPPMMGEDELDEGDYEEYA